jgi:hypothetical protein
MEAQHVQKKYRIIQGSLLEDRVAFESSLVNIEEDIKKQEAEIRHLKVGVMGGQVVFLKVQTRQTGYFVHMCVL